jgi:KDO2-lipid IV(A) lauroyltransferase
MVVYYLLRALSLLVFILPLSVTYFISDILFVISFYLVRYRSDVVKSNLAKSFPEKTEKVRRKIAKKYYHHLCDTFLETLYFDRISARKGKNCLKYLNPELPNNYLDQGRDVVVFLGHYNNWEYIPNWSLYSAYRFYPIYKKLKNKAFERFYFNLRSRFGAKPLERAATFRQLTIDHQNQIPTCSAFVFDQTPRRTDIQHWVTFLNQDTPVILGAEKVAQKLDAAVIFLDIRKIKRGQYEAEFLLVAEHAGACPKYEITNACMQLLEQQIIKNPEYWLWSHRRWKYKKN